MRRLLPLAVLVGLGLVSRALPGDLDGETLRKRHAELTGIVAAYPFLAPAVADVFAKGGGVDLSALAGTPCRGRWRPERSWRQHQSWRRR
ncbi:hypothetical protein [Geminicoccus flavidas]|uniref:hypothetical protein n=1 Tax=Geminicoccus flavidas TaxID=2506407 RepID=UPI0013597B34|nr:hypothetical protein [Geminicoccus flavidas]